MPHPPRSLRRGRVAWCAGATLAVLLVVASLADSSSQQASTRSSSATTAPRCDVQNRPLFACPNCGGTQVDDCANCDGFVNGDVWHRLCIRRVLFQPFDGDPTDFARHSHYLWSDLAGAVVWFLTAAVAIAAGVGGGGIFVPMGILLLQFAPKQASGLSQASVFGASLGGLVLNQRNRHPQERIRSDPGHPDDKDKSDAGRAYQVHLTPQQERDYVAGGGRFYARPLIHYDMALFLAPLEMAGAVLGVLVQKVLPNWLYLLLASLILGFTSYKTYLKFFATRKAELRTLGIADVDGIMRVSSNGGDGYAPVPMSTANEGPTDSGLHPVDPLQQTPEATTSSDHEREPDEAMTQDDREALVPPHPRRGTLETTAGEELQRRIAFLEADAAQYPAAKILALGLLWLGLWALTLLKGGKGVESVVGITCQSPWYMVLIVVQFVWLLGFAGVCGLRLHRDQAARVAVRYPYLEDDPQWDWDSLRLFGGMTLLAGIVAGLIGVGGGMVLGPLMIEIGVNPRVSSATTATMIALTSSSVACMVVTSGIIHWSYAVFFCAVAFAGALFGKSRVDGYVQRTGRTSVIVCILATIIALATVGCLVIMFLGLRERNWCLDGFGAFCTVSSSKGSNDCTTTPDRLLGQLTGQAGSAVSPL